MVNRKNEEMGRSQKGQDVRNEKSPGVVCFSIIADLNF